MLQWINEHFTMNQISLITFVFSIIAAIIYILLFCCILKRNEQRIKKNDGKYVEKMLLSAGNYIEKSGKTEKIKLFLSQYGANYMMGRFVAPEEYMLINLFIGIILCVLGAVNFGIIGCVVGGWIGFNALKWLLILSNDADNKKILYDMKGVYDTLKIKTEGGMFLTSAIQECYKNARNARLKKALMEMHHELIAKSDVQVAVENLNIKFKNKYIDTFCVIIKQSLESGKTVDILHDMSEQLADMQEAINTKIKSKLEAQITVIQLLIYVAIIGISIYGLFMSMKEFAFW